MPIIQGLPDPGPGLRLHLNENTAGCSPRVVAAVQAIGADDLAHYPDYRAAVLATAEHLKVDPDWLVLTNGLDEGVLLAAIGYLGRRTPRALLDRAAAMPPEELPEMLVAVPAFETYVITAEALGARVVTVPLGPDYTFPVDALLGAITPRTRLVYINNPHNPTGGIVPRAAIRRVIDAAPHALVFLDEAYHDFMGDNFLEDAKAHPNVLVGRTFSKAHGLAGIRIGVLVAPPPILEPIRFVMPLFNLNVVAVAALRAALADGAFTPWYVAQVAESKALVYAACERAGLRYWKSAANFVLVDGGARAKDIVSGLKARGVLVRDRTSDPHCPNCFRVTTGVVEHTRAAAEALETVCAAR